MLGGGRWEQSAELVSGFYNWKRLDPRAPDRTAISRSFRDQAPGHDCMVRDENEDKEMEGKERSGTVTFSTVLH